jgi:Glycosyl hydrolases family 28
MAPYLFEHQDSPMMTETYRWPRSMPASDVYRVTVNDQPLTVLRCSVGDYAIAGIAGPAEVRVEVLGPATWNLKADPDCVHPRSRGIEAAVSGTTICFRIDGPDNLLIDLPQLPDLFLLLSPPETDKPDPTGPKVHYFAAGQVYEVGTLELSSGQTVYIEGGAVVRGRIFAAKAEKIEIRGRGIFDNSYFRRGLPDGRKRVMLFEHCQDLRIEGITIIEPSSWTIVPAACDNVTIENVKILGDLSASDGIDIVSCSDVTIRGGLIRAGDDCIAIKSLQRTPQGSRPELVRDVRNVLVEGVSLLSYRGGSAMEIGHELQCKEIAHIVWRDIDVLCQHDFGSAFSIRNCDCATVRDVLYDDIRVEHHYNELIGFRVIRSRYSLTPERGRIRNVVLRNVDVAISPFNPGYSLSHIGGWDDEHNVERVVFENFRLNGKPITSADDLDLYTRHAKGLEFRA